VKNIKLKRYYFILIMVFFIGSIILNVIDTLTKNRVKIYLKDKKFDKLVTKIIVIPKSKSVDEKVYWILKELISGPIENRYERIIDPNIEIKNVVVSKKIVYINFDWIFIDSLYKNPHLVVNSIIKSILANIKGLEGVKILIDGIESRSTFCNISLIETFRNF